MISRICELATQHAFNVHVEAISHGDRAHLDIDRGPSFDEGFAKCPHPDCVLVRTPLSLPTGEASEPAWANVEAPGVCARGHSERQPKCPACHDLRIAAHQLVEQIAAFVEGGDPLRTRHEVAQAIRSHFGAKAEQA